MPKNLPMRECWKRRRARAIESPSKQINSVVEAFKRRRTGPSTSGEGFGGPFLTVAAISAQEAGPGGGVPPLAIARGKGEN